MPGLTVVNSYEMRPDPPLNLLEQGGMEIAMDQRAFGPGRLLLVTAGRSGITEQLAHCVISDPPEDALICCLQHLRSSGDEGALALVLTDEPVDHRPVNDELTRRWEIAADLSRHYGYDLIDWVLCDEFGFRSLELTAHPGDNGPGGRGAGSGRS